MLRSSLLISVGVVAIVVAIAGTIATAVLYYATKAAQTEYGVVIDGGSTHTKLYVYKWPKRQPGTTGNVSQIAKCSVKGGAISSYSTDPEGAGGSLKFCLKKAFNDEVPLLLAIFSPIYLGATAGMRLLQLKSPNKSEAILTSIRDAISHSGFSVINITDQVGIITGQEEGLDAWITAHYLAGMLTAHNQLPDITPSKGWHALFGNDESAALLDMGGASTQVAFAVSNTSLPDSAKYKVKLFGDNFTVFSDTFLCYGGNEFQNRLLAHVIKANSYNVSIKHPCYPDGYTQNVSYSNAFDSPCTKPFRANQYENTTFQIVGTSDNDACSQVVIDLYNVTSCTYSDCSFAGHPFTELPDNIIAKGAFYLTVNDLNISASDGTVSKTVFEETMTNVCKMNYTEVAKNYPFNPAMQCANAYHIHTILTRAYHLNTENKWQHIKFANEVDGADIGWTLGYMIHRTNSLPAGPTKLTLYNMSMLALGIGLAVCGFLFVIGIVALGCGCARRRRERYHGAHTLLSSSF